MTRNDRINAQILAAEAWARDEIARCAPVVSICGKPDDHIYAIVKYRAAVEQVLADLHYVTECLEADRFGEPRPAPRSDRAARTLVHIITHLEEDP